MENVDGETATEALVGRCVLEPCLSSLLGTPGLREGVLHRLVLSDWMNASATCREVRASCVAPAPDAVILEVLELRRARKLPELLRRLRSVRALRWGVPRAEHFPNAACIERCASEVEPALAAAPPLKSVDFDATVSDVGWWQTDEARREGDGVRCAQREYARAVWRGLTVAGRPRLRALVLRLSFDDDWVLPTPQQLVALAPRELTLVGIDTLAEHGLALRLAPRQLAPRSEARLWGSLGSRAWCQEWSRPWSQLRRLLRGEVDDGGASAPRFLQYTSVRELTLRGLNAAALDAPLEGERVWHWVGDHEWELPRVMSVDPDQVPQLTLESTVRHARALEDLRAFPHVREVTMEHVPVLAGWRHNTRSLWDDALLLSSPHPNTVRTVELGPASRVTPDGLARHADSITSLAASWPRADLLSQLPSLLRGLQRIHLEDVTMEVALLGEVAALPRLQRLELQNVSIAGWGTVRLQCWSSADGIVELTAACRECERRRALSPLGGVLR
jgi:hypothetical protein